jgi:hypothetical protein
MATQTKRRTGKPSEAGRRTKAAANKGSSARFRKTAEHVQALAPVGVKLASSPPVKAAISRLRGDVPSRRQALLAASLTGVAGAVGVYRLLRSGD